MAEQLRGPFEDSSSYSELEFCAGALTVSFSDKVSPRSFQTALIFIGENNTK
jgi:hypothetical protein